MRHWVEAECVPAEARLERGEDFATVLAELRRSARSQGIWTPFVPKEYGGMGLGPLANALVQMELGASRLAALGSNSQAPDDATILTILAHGSDHQKAKFLKPLLEGEKRVCYAMTEPGGGADATGMRTEAVRKGDTDVLNGDKWFISAASTADIALVMARTNPDAPRHRQFSTFIVELPDPGFDIRRNIATMAVHEPCHEEMGATHSEVLIRNLVVPAENLLGGEGNGFAMGQHRLAYGRLRHGMHSIAIAQRALDLAAARVVSRESFGSRVADRQGVQWMLADCASQLYVGRLMLLHIAYKAEKGLDLRQENSIAKVYLAHMVHKVVDTALQLHGALGYSQDAARALVHRGARAASCRRARRGPPLDRRTQRDQGIRTPRHHRARGRRRPALGHRLIMAHPNIDGIGPRRRIGRRACRVRWI